MAAIQDRLPKLFYLLVRAVIEVTQVEVFRWRIMVCGGRMIFMPTQAASGSRRPAMFAATDFEFKYPFETEAILAES